MATKNQATPGLDKAAGSVAGEGKPPNEDLTYRLSNNLQPRTETEQGTESSNGHGEGGPRGGWAEKDEGGTRQRSQNEGDCPTRFPTRLRC